MWVLGETDLYGRRFKEYLKKHPDELRAVLNNLDTYFGALSAGVNPLQIKAGFIHVESQGVVALDQTGAPRKLRETRLYVYAVEIERTLHLITIGDKSSQKSDLADCRKFVTQIKKDSANG